MACAICSGVLNDCPVCGAGDGARYTSWEERLDSRRNQPSKDTGVTQRDIQTGAAKHGQYAVDTGGDRTGPKYSRSFNSGYDGPGAGTW